VKPDFHQIQKKQIDSHKVCSKWPPLTQTQACKRVGHWSTMSSISDCSKPRHTRSRRCHSSSVSWTWQWRHIYVTCKMNKYNSLLVEHIHSRFQICKKLLKFVKIFQSYDHKCTATFFCESQCIPAPTPFIIISRLTISSRPSLLTYFKAMLSFCTLRTSCT